MQSDWPKRRTRKKKDVWPQREREEATPREKQEDVETMTDDRTELTKDGRPIQAVCCPADTCLGYRVGQDNITAIKPYCEHGQYSMLPWVAVYSGNKIVVRIPAQHVSIHYE